MEQTDSLAVGKKFDILLTRYVIFELDIGLTHIQYILNLSVINLEIYDAIGPLKFTRDQDSVIISLRRRTRDKERISLKFKILIAQPWYTISEIKMFTWSAKDLFEVKFSDPIFYRISGFAKLTRMKNNPRIVIATKNLSAKFKDHISNSRGIIIAVSDKRQPKYYISTVLEFKSSVEIGKIHDLKIVTPQSDKYKFVKISKIINLEQTPKIDKDEQGNNVILFDEFNIQSTYQRIEVIAEISLNPRDENIDLTELGTMDMLRKAVSRSQGGIYLTNEVQGAFEYRHPKIQKYAKAAKAKSSVLSAHQLLFELANRELKYKISEGRRSSTWAIENGIGDCSEFSYLLVSLHRAAGIPSRVVEGNVITEDGKLQGHGWVEFLSPTKGWVQCDPTWGLVLGVSPLHIRYVTHSSGDSPNYITYKCGSHVNLNWKFELKY